MNLPLSCDIWETSCKELQQRISIVKLFYEKGRLVWNVYKILSDICAQYSLSEGGIERILARF